jgi:hypothetical protein
MSQPMPNQEPSKAAAPLPGVPEERDAASYRAGLEHAMTVIWHEKQKHSVITPAYFALAKVWDELYHAANPNAAGEKH